MLNEIMIEITPLLVRLIGLILIAVMGMLFKYLFDLDKVQKILMLEEALEVVWQTARDITKSTKKQVLDELEEEPEGLNRELINRIKRIAIEKIKREVPDMFINLLGLVEENLDSLLGDFVESFLEDEEADIKKE